MDMLCFSSTLLTVSFGPVAVVTETVDTKFKIVPMLQEALWTSWYRALFVLNAQFGKVGPIFVDSAFRQLNPSDLDAPRLDEIPPGI
jgi:hypothetical protein